MNTKHKKYKEYLRLERKSVENDTAQKNLGYKELDEPIRDGYNINFVLRKDITRREDAWLYEALVRDFSDSGWCRDKSFEKYNWRTRKKESIKPHFKLLRERDYDKYIPIFQKLWEHDPSEDKPNFWYGGVEKYYRVNVPDWFFETKITKHYRTHYKVVDEVLLQEEAFLRDKMWEGKYRAFGWMNGGMKPYAQIQNRSDRSYNKQTLKHNMTLREPIRYVDEETGMGYDCDEDWCAWEEGRMQGKEFRYAHKHSAKWDRW